MLRNVSQSENSGAFCHFRFYKSMTYRKIQPTGHIFCVSFCLQLAFETGFAPVNNEYFSGHVQKCMQDLCKVEFISTNIRTYFDGELCTVVIHQDVYYNNTVNDKLD
jgi:hypothetical protein